MFGNLKTGSDEWISVIIPLEMEPLKTGIKLVEELWTFPCKPKVFRNRVRKAIINGVK